jgi:hypothetical protein
MKEKAKPMRNEELDALLTLATVVLPLAVVACAHQVDRCPVELITSTYAQASTIRWGGSQEKVSANIEKVQAQCVRRLTPPIESEGRKIGSMEMYDIAVTVTVNQTITDSLYYRAVDLNPTLILDANTATGVVLQSATATVDLAGPVRTARASGTISGLTPEQVKLVRGVVVRWDYGQ